MEEFVPSETFLMPCLKSVSDIVWSKVVLEDCRMFVRKAVSSGGGSIK